MSHETLPPNERSIWETAFAIECRFERDSPTPADAADRAVLRYRAHLESDELSLAKGAPVKA